jgi:acetyltransferase-like isoleucine patch superfamily enzyme
MFKKKLYKALAKMALGYKLRIWLLRRCNYLIGEQVFIGEGLLVIDDVESDAPNLVIGDRAAVSPRVTLVLHSVPNWSRIADHVNSVAGTIVIERDAWIGTGSVILPNVTIGEGAVVGANSLVRRNVPPYTIVGGVPAREIKKFKVPFLEERGGASVEKVVGIQT